MIGNRTRWMTGALVGAGLLLGSIAPAQARPRYDDRGWHHGHHRGDGFDFGDAVGIAALLGAAVVVANSVSKDRKDARDTDADNRPYADNDAPPPTGGTDYGADARDAGPPARADDFSDVAATKACRKAGIALPRRGHWLRSKKQRQPKPEPTHVPSSRPLQCSGLMKPDTHLGENARQIEVSDDQTTPLLYS